MKDNKTINTICEYIRNKIMTKEMFPGYRIVEEDISAKLNVSRTPIRSAFAILQSEGFVDIIPNKGTFVIQPTREEIVRVYEARVCIESGLLQNVCDRLTDADLKDLKENYAKQIKLVDNFSMLEYSILNREFHIRLAELSQNKYLKRHVSEIYNRVFIYLVFYDNSVSNVGSILTHGNIIQALEARDEKKLLDAVREDAQLAMHDICNNL